MRVLEKTFFTVVTLLLVFILGFASFPLALFGAGYVAYSYVSIDKLEEIGVLNIDTSEIFDISADVSLTSLTIQGLVNEISLLSGMGSVVTIDFLIDRYGLKLNEQTLGYLPEDLRSLPLTLVFSNGGVNAVLDSVKVSYIFQFLPEGVLSAPAREQLGDKTFGDVVALNLGYLLEDVCLGYLLGVNYELDADGEYRVAYLDPEHPTLLELMAPIDLGSFLTAVTSGDDVVAAVVADIGDVALQALVETVMGSEGYIFPGLLGDKVIDDIVKVDSSTGKSVLNLSAIFEDRLFGHVLGYYPIYCEGTDIVIGWTLDPESGRTIVGVMRGLACASVDGILDEGFDFGEIISDIYVGDALEFVPHYNEYGELVEWTDADNNPIVGARRDLAFKTIGELSSGGFTVEDVLGENPHVGELLGYTYDEANDVWLDEDGNPLKGVASVFADLTFKELGTSAVLNEKIEQMTVADILGYSKDEGGWKDSHGNEVTGIMALLADSSVGGVGASMNGMTIGAIMGYTRDDSRGKWYKGEGAEEEELTGVMASFADLTVSQLSDSSAFTERLNRVALADALGYTKGADGWVDSKGDPVTGIMAALADTHIGDVSSKMSTLEIGTIMGYTKDGDKWTIGDGELTGVVTAFADLTVNDMSDPAIVSEKIKSITLADALGYTKEGGKWKDPDGNEVTGVMAALADSQVKDVGSKMNDMKIGSVMGYTRDGDGPDDKWINEDGELTGVMTAFADLSINEMANAERVTEQMSHMFDTMSMGDLQTHGIIVFEDDTVATLDAIDSDWRNETIHGFVPFLIGKLSPKAPGT